MLPAIDPLGPRAIERPADDGYTLVGILDEPSPALVDRAGLVQLTNGEWSIDWWIGADDRWYFPSREATLRQRRLGYGPVIQTAVRIPSGDALHRTYPVTVDGKTATVIEVENDSPVPVALAMAVRPYTHDGTPSSGPVAITDRSVRVGGRVALNLPRRPNERVATNRDAAEIILAGESLTGAAEAAGEHPNGVVLYPLPHRTTLRFVVTHDGTVLDSNAVPTVEEVERGWTSVVESGGRFELPDNGLTALANGARARLMLGPRRLGADLSELVPGAGDELRAMTTSGAVGEARLALLEFASSFPSRLGGSPSDAASIVDAAGRALAALDDRELADESLTVLVRLASLIKKSKQAEAHGIAARGLGFALLAARQKESARALFGDHPPVLPRLEDEELSRLAEAAAESGSWGRDERAAAVAFWNAMRARLLSETVDVVDLAPGLPVAWRGGNFEVHNALTVHGRISFAVRWHGARPALLWDADFCRPVTLRSSRLDPDFSTDQPQGETLLAGSADGLIVPPGEGESFA